MATVDRVPNRAGQDLLNRIVSEVHRASQAAASEEEHGLFTITLQVLSQVRRGSSQPWQEACYAAFGNSFEAWREHNQARLATQARELEACAPPVPDYDPEEAKRAQMEQANRLRRPQESGRAVFEVPEPPQPLLYQSVHVVPGEATNPIPAAAP